MQGRDTDHIIELSAVSLVELIASRALSCEEVMQAYLNRIDECNGRVNAIVALREHDLLLEQARGQDALLRRGVETGPLFGLPLAIKDLVPVRGIVTSMGSPLFRDFVPSSDGVVVTRLREAGASIIGKTNTPEFGLGSHTYNSVYGTTFNPYDVTRSAGGSSGGAAAALALDMVPIADGSDFGGSLRNPAAWNNVFGLRPSIGRVPDDEPDQWLPSMAVTGPLARSVPDLALQLSVMAGFDPRSPLSLEGDGREFLESLDVDLRGTRIGWLGDFRGAVPYDPEILDVCRRALGAFETVGCAVAEAWPAHPTQPVWSAVKTLRSWEIATGLGPLYDKSDTRAMLKPEAVWEVELGRHQTGDTIAAASVVRTAWTHAFLDLFDEFDFLVLPSTQVGPFPATLDWPHSVLGRTMESYHEWMEGNLLITMTGLPSLAAPAGFDRSGLPVGLQIIGRHRSELSCLRMAHAYAQASAAVIGRRPPAKS